MTTTTAPMVALTRGDRMLCARRRRGLEQSELAEMMGISRNSVSLYENDRSVPRDPVLFSWAHHTGVPFEWLKDGDHTCPNCGNEVAAGMTCSCVFPQVSGVTDTRHSSTDPQLCGFRLPADR